MARRKFRQVMRLLRSAWLASVTVLTWLVLGFDGRLHWDEPQYLYAGAYIPTAEIIDGEFEPSSVPGFNVSRIGHVVLVKGMAWLLGAGPQLVALVIALYAATLVAFFVIGFVVLRDLGVPSADAGLATVAVMLSPIGLYLAGKTLPDIPALMWASLAVLAAIRLVGDGRRWLWYPVGILALALAALTKHVLIWTFVAFAAAALVAGPAGMPRARLLVVLTALTAVSLALFAGVLALAGIDLPRFLAFLAMASRASEPLAAKSLHLAIALGLLWVPVGVAAFHRPRPLVRFFWLWFAIAALPFLVIAPRLEIRYLAPALMPLAGLVYLSFDLLRRLPVLARHPRSLAASLVIFMVLAGLSSRSVQTLTAHEVEMASLHRLLERLDRSFGPGAYAFVSPWEYSTFLYLRLVYPDREVYDAFDPRRNYYPEWWSAQERFFAGRVLRNVDQARAIGKPLVYVGFAEAMPVSNLRRLARLVPEALGAPLTRRLDSLDTLKHLSLSWMWDEPGLSLEPIDQVGNYLVYQVTLPDKVARKAQS